MVFKKHDDYNWDTYTQTDYKKQLETFLLTGDANGNGKDMIVNNFSIVDGELNLKDNLHPNWKELYHQVTKLNVKKIFECGCGCAHHLINIYRINPEIDINGCDYSQSQINLGKEKFNLNQYPFSNKLYVKDLAIIQNIKDEDISDFVFTQAVTMHLEHNKAKNMLINMGKLSSKYIFLMENWSKHNYENLLSEALPNFKIIHRPNDSYKYQNYCLLEKI